MSKIGRRGFASVVGAVTLGAPVVAREAAASTPAGKESAPWSLIAPVGPDDEIGHGWRVESLTPIQGGAAVLMLAHAASSRVARVDLCLRGDDPCGIAQTRQLDFILMNGTSDITPSDEDLGRALRALAGRIDAAPPADPFPRGLEPHANATHLPLAGGADDGEILG